MAEHAKEAGGKGGKGGSKKAPDGSKKAKPKKAKASALVETPPVMDAATTFRATFGQLLQGPGGGGAAQSANDGKKLANGCPADMPKRYPNNNRCFERIWGGKACNVDPKNDPLDFQRNDRACKYDCDLKAVKPGKSTVSCNGIAYDFHVPKDGCDGKCGLIMDVHGSGMNAAMEEASSGIAKYANPQGYVVIQPSSADADFSTSKDKDGNLDNGWAEIDDMVAFLRLVVAEASDMIDAKKVHMAGFSQGAFVAWNALCRASDLICSIAPTGFNAYGEYDQGIFKALGLKQVTHSNCWLDAKGPKIPRSIWYASGKHDILGGPALFKKSMDSVKKAYGLGNGVEKQTDFSGAEWTQYPTLPQGVNVESTLFDYESPAVWPGVGAIKGHCFPSSQTGGAPAFPMTSCGGPGAYSWGKEAVNFFKANPCQDKAAAAAPVAVPALTQAAALKGGFAGKERPAYPPCTKASLTAGGQSGSMFQCSGPGPRGGHINYEITVPTHCTSASKCGVIINTHGQTMTAAHQEAETGVRAAALSGKKFIVINPEDADSAWEFKALGQNDDAQLVGEFIFEKALPVFEDIVDRNRIHAMGFSAGAITSYLLLCKYSQHVCSVAGVGMTPQLEMTYFNAGGLPTCFNTNLGGTGPTHKRSISIHAGTTDHYFQGHAKNSLPHAVSMVKSLYGISSDGEKLSKGAGVDWTRYTKGKLTLEAAAYDFNAPGAAGGHCIPKKGVAFPEEGSAACGKDSAGDVSAYSWGVEALKFLEANPCN
jgi:poly(3-hydroxybutyrate) depolymerase